MERPRSARDTPHFDRAIGGPGANESGAVVIDAEDVALVAGKDSVGVKGRLSFRQLSVDTVNPELKSAAENGIIIIPWVLPRSILNAS